MSSLLSDPGVEMVTTEEGDFRESAQSARHLRGSNLTLIHLSTALDSTYVSVDELATALHEYRLDVSRFRPLMDQLPPSLQGRLRSSAGAAHADIERIVVTASGGYRRDLRAALHEFVVQHIGLWYLLQGTFGFNPRACLHLTCDAL